MSENLTPEILLRAYRAGIFPMADDAEAKELFWYDPPERTHFPLDQFHVPARLRRTIRHWPYGLTINKDFGGVMRHCAAANPARGRDKTWINAEIINLYSGLHAMGRAHSLEAWHEGRLVGGLYGVQIGGAFFGESMFSSMNDASKICLVALVARLRQHGFALLDCQFMTKHLAQFGAETISRAAYHALLHKACALQCPPLGSAIGGTYPGTGVGKPSAGTGGFAAGSAAPVVAGGVDTGGVDTGDGALAASVKGFLHEITQTS